MQWRTSAKVVVVRACNSLEVTTDKTDIDANEWCTSKQECFIGLELKSVNLIQSCLFKREGTGNWPLLVLDIFWKTDKFLLSKGKYLAHFRTKWRLMWLLYYTSNLSRNTPSFELIGKYNWDIPHFYLRNIQSRDEFTETGNSLSRNTPGFENWEM